MKRAVLVLCDGHRSDFCGGDIAPAIAALSDRGRRCTHHRSIVPSVTRSVSAAIATGCLPMRNGIHGNLMALEDRGGMSIVDLGEPDFREHLRRITGRTLHRPTIAERVAGQGGSVVYSNVSYGAAYLQDPDGYGYVYHRQGSSGPGASSTAGIADTVTSKDLASDQRMTDLFCADALQRRRPAFSVLWLANPDETMHDVPLGSPAHLEAIRGADACVGRVVEAVDRRRRAGDDILLMVGSDHGHETVTAVVHLDRLLVDAGLKQSITSSDVVVVPQEFSCMIYIADREHTDAVLAFLRDHDWFGEAFVGDGLAGIGLPNGALTLAVTARHTMETNDFGVPGSCVMFACDGEGLDQHGNGSHGGLGPHDQSPFLIVDTNAAAGGRPVSTPTSVLDIAPTILHHLGLPSDDMDGRPISLV